VSEGPSGHLRNRRGVPFERMLGSHERNFIHAHANKLLLNHGGRYRGDADVSKRCGCMSHPDGRTEDVPKLNI